MSTPPGLCIWLTGLPCSGKTTTAQALVALLSNRQPRLLDGDAVRAQVSPALGFSKADRNTNVHRLAALAAEGVREGAVVIVAAVSPYQAAREDARARVGHDRFFEVFVDTPSRVCEERDVKGMYGKARRGELQHFTGVDDPYERPESPAVRLDTLSHTADDNARAIVGHLRRLGLL